MVTERMIGLTRWSRAGMLVVAVATVGLGGCSEKSAPKLESTAPASTEAEIAGAPDELLVMDVVKHEEEARGLAMQPAQHDVRLEFEKLQVQKPYAYHGKPHMALVEGMQVYPVKMAYQRLWAKGRTAERVAISRNVLFFKTIDGDWTLVDPDM